MLCSFTAQCTLTSLPSQQEAFVVVGKSKGKKMAFESPGSTHSGHIEHNAQALSWKTHTRRMVSIPDWTDLD